MEPTLPDLTRYWLAQSVDADPRYRAPAGTEIVDDLAAEEKALAELVERVNAARGIA